MRAANNATTGPKHGASPRGRAQCIESDRNLEAADRGKWGRSWHMAAGPKAGRQDQGCPEQDRPAARLPHRTCTSAVVALPATLTALLWSLLRGPAGAGRSHQSPPARQRPADYISCPRSFTWDLSSRPRNPSPQPATSSATASPTSISASRLLQRPSNPPVAAPSPLAILT